MGASVRVAHLQGLLLGVAPPEGAVQVAHHGRLQVSRVGQVRAPAHTLAQSVPCWVQTTEPLLPDNVVEASVLHFVSEVL